VTGSLRGAVVNLRPAGPGDAERLAEILTHPEIARWWPGFDLERVREDVLGDEDSVVYAVEADGQVIGLVQYAEETDPEYRHASIDVTLHPDWHRRGLGADAVRTLARHLFDGCGHHRITIDPAAHNERAVRSYIRVGFRPVGVMRRYELGADGTWHDGLLMDLLPEELTEGPAPTA
jgi:aminoglycoside 6'-N-acetyltransferase